jgi:predicted DNA-binding transcriptional regulator AlpA
VSEHYLPAAKVRERYGVTDMSLWRWLHNEALSFPRPLEINGRRYWKLADLISWEESRVKLYGKEAAHVAEAS